MSVTRGSGGVTDGAPDGWLAVRIMCIAPPGLMMLSPLLETVGGRPCSGRSVCRDPRLRGQHLRPISVELLV